MDITIEISEAEFLSMITEAYRKKFSISCKEMTIEDFDWGDPGILITLREVGNQIGAYPQAQTYVSEVSKSGISSPVNVNNPYKGMTLSEAESFGKTLEAEFLTKEDGKIVPLKKEGFSNSFMSNLSKKSLDIE